MRAFLVGFSLALVVGLPARAQFFERLLNPDVEVTLNHPPGLRRKIERVAFAPVNSEVADEFVAACISDLASDVEIVDRANLERLFREQKLSNSGLVDSASAVELGKVLGSPMLLNVKVYHYKVTRTQPRETLITKDKKDKDKEIKQTVYGAKIQAEFSVSVQAVDCATGKIYAAQRVVADPFLVNKSVDAQPDHPSETEVREKAFATAKLQVRRMLLSWTEPKKLIFYDDQEFGMKEAYKRLKAKDYPGALGKAQESVKLAQQDPQKRPKFLGRTAYNLGIAHFILGDYEAAQPYLKQAREIDVENGIYRQALEECDHAIQLMRSMSQAADPGAAALAPKAEAPKAEGGKPSLEDRLERLDRLKQKNLITPEEYQKRREELLKEI